MASIPYDFKVNSVEDVCSCIHKFAKRYIVKEGLLLSTLKSLRLYQETNLLYFMCQKPVKKEKLCAEYHVFKICFQWTTKNKFGLKIFLFRILEF